MPLSLRGHPEHPPGNATVEELWFFHIKWHSMDTVILFHQYVIVYAVFTQPPFARTFHPFKTCFLPLIICKCVKADTAFICINLSSWFGQCCCHGCSWGRSWRGIFFAGRLLCCQLRCALAWPCFFLCSFLSSFSCLLCLLFGCFLFSFSLLCFFLHRFSLSFFALTAFPFHPVPSSSIPLTPEVWQYTVH